MEGGGGVHGKFLHILVFEFVNLRHILVPGMFCFVSLLGRLKVKGSQFMESNVRQNRPASSVVTNDQISETFETYFNNFYSP